MSKRLMPKRYNLVRVEFQAYSKNDKIIKKQIYKTISDYFIDT